MIYAVLGTILTHLIGWPLVGIDFRQQQFEADFRFNLVRVRENSEQIALLRGEEAERERLLARFGRVVENWLAIMSRTKKVTAFTASYSQASVIFPYILVAPAYFAQKIQLGGMMQTASAFSSVQGALSFFITVYRQLAEWQAVVNRLDGFEAGIGAASALATRADRIHVTSGAGDGTISLKGLTVRLPNGTPLVTADGFSFRKDERTLVTGPSGSGKSTMFRAIAGIWPFGAGSIAVPAERDADDAAAAAVFPGRIAAGGGRLSRQGGKLHPAANRAKRSSSVGLPKLASRLDEQGHWNRMLSLGEQQRLGLARALLHAPQFLFLDEATASLDEPSEAALYQLLAQKLPATTIVSIGHRSTLEAFHQRNVALARDGEQFVLQDKSEGAKAS